jgi:glutaredoxin 3
MSRVRIYTKPDCPFSERARSFLEEKGIPYEEIDVTQESAKAEMVAAAGGAVTTPQIFIDGDHLGGYDDLVAEDRLGHLAATMASGFEEPMRDST